MATVITSECINCGACEPECPNTAIYQGGVEWELNGVTHPAISGDIFYIVPEKCTECVGFHDHEACAAVCPVDCCIPDPKIPETEDVLIVRAQQLHPEASFPPDFPSRFRKEGAAAPPAAPAAVAVPAPAAAPIAAPAAAAPPLVVPTASPTAGSVSIPDLDEWEVPIDCHRCSGTYAVPFKHFRSGIVFRCPYCQGSFVVQSSMHAEISRALHEFHTQWHREFDTFQQHRQQEIDEFEERQRTRAQTFNESLKTKSHDFRPPGAPRKRAWIFG